MRTAIVLLVLLGALVAAPAVAAQNDTTVNYPDEVNVDVNDNDGDADEAVGFAGLSGTALIVLVILAVIVIALIVAVASRDRYP